MARKNRSQRKKNDPIVPVIQTTVPLIPVFFSITFSFRSQAKVQELEPTFHKAKDWIRYAPNCWIVKTTSSAARWLARFKPYLNDNDVVMIIPFDPQQVDGWLPQWVWKWIESLADSASTKPQEIEHGQKTT